MRMAEVVLPRPGPPMSRQRPRTAKVSRGMRTKEEYDGAVGR